MVDELHDISSSKLSFGGLAVVRFYKLLNASEQTPETSELSLGICVWVAMCDMID